MITFFANNDFDPTIEVTWLTTNGQSTRPYETGDGPAPTAFLANASNTDVLTSDPESDADLACTVTYVGVGGVWRLHIDASNMTTTLLDAKFPDGVAYLHIRTTSGSRQQLRVAYVRDRAAVEG